MTPNKYLTDYRRDHPPVDSDEERDHEYALLMDIRVARMRREHAIAEAQRRHPSNSTDDGGDVA